MNSSYVKSQQACAALLPDLITRGAAAFLESPVWTIGYTGMTGELTGLLQTPAQQREDFAAWADLLGATTRREETASDGTVRLVAGVEHAAGGWVVLRATVQPSQPDTTQETT